MCIHVNIFSFLLRNVYLQNVYGATFMRQAVSFWTSLYYNNRLNLQILLETVGRDVCGPVIS